MRRRPHRGGPTIFSLVLSMKEVETSMPANSLQEREQFRDVSWDILKDNS
jgi:hypothetical protein